MAEATPTDPSFYSESADGDTIRVCVRVRPPLDDYDIGSCLEVKDRQALVMQSKPDPKTFTFDYVADICITQDAVFTTVARRIIEGCISGYNGTIFAYGQTGSGKTFTMLGPNDITENLQHELRGVIPRSFEFLFSQIKRKKEEHGDKIQFVTNCSFLEIYNENIYDLLDPVAAGLQLRENIKKGVFVDGLTEKVISTAVEAYSVLSDGWKNRTVAATSMNRESSRSHAVFTVTVESKFFQNGVWNVKTSQLNLVDLAGSERQKDTNTLGIRLKEAGSINKSLSTLGHVIMALGDIAHGKTRHVPYRDSKLSFLLRDSLGGNAKTYIIACIHPGAKWFGETLSTLQFARRAKMIKNKAVVNEDMQGSITLLQAELKRLKEQLSQFQQSGVPGGLSAGGSGDCTLQVGGDALKWKTNFVNAMRLLQRSQTDKQALEGQVCNLKEVIAAKVKILQTKVMVLKFREEALKKYEKACKEKRDMTSQEKDDVIGAMQEEKMHLQYQCDHHPDVAHYRLEAEVLHEDVTRLRALLDTQLNEQQLHTLYISLTKDEPTDDEKLRATVAATNDEQLANAALNRVKGQLEKTSEELKQVKAESKHQQDEQGKKIIQLTAEIESLKTRNQHMEKTIEYSRMNGLLEREMHLDTIKNLTPRKTGKLMTSPGRPFALNLNDSTISDQFDLMNERPPDMMYEELEQEFHRTQEQIIQLRNEVEMKEKELIDIKGEKARVESEKNQLQQLLDKQNQALMSQEQLTEESLNNIKRQMAAQEENLSHSREEVKEWNLMYTSLERKMKELKAEKEQLYTDKALIETKLVDLEIKANFMDSELNETLQECERLKESEETAQATLSFTKDLLSEAEAKSRLQEAKCADLGVQVKELTATLQSIELERLALVQRLQAEDNEKTKQLVDSAGTVQHLQTQVTQLQGKEAAIKEALNRQTKEMADKVEEMDKLKKSQKELQEVYQTVVNTVQELRDRCHRYEQDLDSARSELIEVKDRNTVLQEGKEKLEVELSDMKHSFLEKVAEGNRKQFELDVIQDDLEQTMEQYKNLEAKENESRTTIKKLKDDIDSLKEVKNDLEKKVSDLELELMAAQNQLVLKNQSHQHEIERWNNRLVSNANQFSEVEQDITSLRQKSKQMLSTVKCIVNKPQQENGNSKATATTSHNKENTEPVEVKKMRLDDSVYEYTLSPVHYPTHENTNTLLGPL